MTGDFTNLSKLYEAQKQLAAYNAGKNRTEEQKTLADVNKDGKVDSKDKTAIDKNIKAAKKNNAHHNLNKDSKNKVDVNDWLLFKDEYDLDGDGNISDEEKAFLAAQKAEMRKEVLASIKKDKWTGVFEGKYYLNGVSQGTALAEGQKGTLTINGVTVNWELTGNVSEPSIKGSGNTITISGTNCKITISAAKPTSQIVIKGSNMDVTLGAAVKSLTNHATGKTTITGRSDGDDTIINKADGKNITINGGGGNNTINNYGKNVTINGGSGNDKITNYSAATGVNINGGDGNDTIKNSAKNATINGGAGNDNIANSGEKVTINGDAGNDTIKNTAKNATINGGAGNDTITNSGKSAKIDGGEGNDKITNTGASSTISGGSGDDTITNKGSKAKIQGGRGSDTVYNSGSDVTIKGGSGNDKIYNYLLDKNGKRSGTGGNNITIDLTDGNDKVYLAGNKNVTINNVENTDSISGANTKTKINSRRTNIEDGKIGSLSYAVSKLGLSATDVLDTETDTNGRILKIYLTQDDSRFITLSYENGALTAKFTTNGNISRKDEFDANGNKTKREDYTYDANGRTVLKTEYDASGKITTCALRGQDADAENTRYEISGLKVNEWANNTSGYPRIEAASGKAVIKFSSSISIEVKDGDKAEINADGTLKVTDKNGNVRNYTAQGVEILQGASTFGSQDYLGVLLGISSFSGVSGIKRDNSGKITEFVLAGVKYEMTYSGENNVTVSAKGTGNNRTETTSKYTGGVLLEQTKDTYANNKLNKREEYKKVADGTTHKTTNYNTSGAATSVVLEGKDTNGNTKYKVTDNYNKEHSYPKITSSSATSLEISFSASKKITINNGSTVEISPEGLVTVINGTNIARYLKDGTEVKQGTNTFGSQEYVGGLIGITDFTSATGVKYDAQGRISEFVLNNIKYNMTYSGTNTVQVVAEGSGANRTKTTSKFDNKVLKEETTETYENNKLKKKEVSKNINGGSTLETTNYNTSGAVTSVVTQGKDTNGNVKYTITDNYHNANGYPKIASSGATSAQIAFSANKKITINAGDSVVINGDRTVSVTKTVNGKPVITKYDKDGNVVGNSEIREQDPQGRPTTVVETRPDGSTVTTTYEYGTTEGSYTATTVDSSTGERTVLTYSDDKPVSGTRTVGGVTYNLEYHFNDDGSFALTETNRTTRENVVYSYNAQNVIQSSVTTKPDGRKIDGTYTDGQLTHTKEYNRPDGAIIENDIDSEGKAYQGTKTIGKVVYDLTYRYNGDGTSVRTEINRANSEQTVYQVNAQGVDVSSSRTRVSDGARIDCEYTNGVLTKQTETYRDNTVIVRDSFDAQGRCTHAEKTLPNGQKVDVKYDYNADGSYVRTETNQTTHAYSRATVNKNGQTTLNESFDANGNIIKRSTYKYNTDNSYTREETNFQNGDRTTYHYGTDGKITDSTTVNNNSDPKKIERTYTNGILSGQKDTMKDGTVINKVMQNGKPVSGTKILPDNTEITMKWTYGGTNGSYQLEETNTATGDVTVFNYDKNNKITSSRTQKTDGTVIEGRYTNGALTGQLETYTDGITIDRTIQNGVCYKAVKTLKDGTKIDMEYTYKTDGSYTLKETNRSNGDVTTFQVNADGQITFARTVKADRTIIEDEYENGLRMKSTESYVDGSKNVKYFMADGREKYEEKFDSDGVITKLGFNYDIDGSYTITEATPSTGEVIRHTVDAQGNKTTEVLVSAQSVREAERTISSSNLSLLDKICSLVKSNTGANVRNAAQSAIQQAIQDYRDNKSIGYLRYHITNILTEAGFSTKTLRQALNNRTTDAQAIEDLCNTIIDALDTRKAQEEILAGALEQIEMASSQDSQTVPVTETPNGNSVSEEDNNVSSDETNKAGSTESTDNNSTKPSSAQKPATTTNAKYAPFYGTVKYSAAKYQEYCQENPNNAFAFYEITGANGITLYKLRTDLTQAEFEKLSPKVQSFFSAV